MFPQVEVIYAFACGFCIYTYVMQLYSSVIVKRFSDTTKCFIIAIFSSKFKFIYLDDNLLSTGTLELN